MGKIQQVKLLNFKETVGDLWKEIELQNTGGGYQSGIPFDIKRIFYMYGSDPEIVRGNHANRDSEFVLISVRGTSKVKVDDGKNSEIYCLDTPATGLYMPAMIWKEMYDFSKESILLALSSHKYDSEEYIRSYDNFLKITYGK